MRQHALSVIRDEHQALAAMLRSLSLLVQQSRRRDELPPFDVLRAMLFYIDEFPERLHHPKESQLLFPRLRERAPELAQVLDRLDRDHEIGARAIRDLQHALLAFEVMGVERRVAFEDALDRYIDAHLVHMACEEHEVLPTAQRVLTDADWIELDAAFAANRDPLTGFEPEEGYRPLFQRILNAAPAPVGLG
ncbi:MAG: hemerythrin domain-containing protein [Rubrivivax sp.]